MVLQQCIYSVGPDQMAAIACRNKTCGTIFEYFILEVKSNLGVQKILN
jgi:hypothetical protein